MIAVSTGAETISSIIATSVAPVFLLAAVGAILNVYSQRLSRVVDKYERVNARLDKVDAAQCPEKKYKALVNRLEFLAKRVKIISNAITFCTLTGLFISVVIVLLFSSLFFDLHTDIYIAGLFSAAMISLAVSLSLFLKEVLYSDKILDKIKR